MNPILMIFLTEKNIGFYYKSSNNLILSQFIDTLEFSFLEKIFLKFLKNGLVTEEFLRSLNVDSENLIILNSNSKNNIIFLEDCKLSKKNYNFISKKYKIFNYEQILDEINKSNNFLSEKCLLLKLNEKDIGVFIPPMELLKLYFMEFNNINFFFKSFFSRFNFFYEIIKKTKTFYIFTSDSDFFKIIYDFEKKEIELFSIIIQNQ
jgi:hypothetical protein